MIDFKEMPKDGMAFEQLLRELLFSYGMTVQWSGRGPDGGRDLVCRERQPSLIAETSKTWLVQCKHFAHGNRSVGIEDLDNIVDSCAHHGATGYLLACSTQPSSAVVNRLESITGNKTNSIVATFWDGVDIERLLSRPRHWAIAQRFFPISASKWKIYATERPNDFVAHYKGYVFHLTNRIGSLIDHHLSSIEERISEIEDVANKLPNGHIIRPRAVWYDDKHGSYTWYVDYLYPHNATPATSEAAIKVALHDNWALDDGKMYNWDVQLFQYWPHSDHYDQDHYDYYVRYMPNFLEGANRDGKNWQRKYATESQLAEIEQETLANAHVAFDALVETFRKVSFVKVIRAVNAGIESVARLERRYVWRDVLQKLDQDVSHLFDALIILDVADEEKFHDLLSTLPIGVEYHFRVSRVYVYSGDPDDGLGKADDSSLFDLKLTIHPILMTDQFATRQAFDRYFVAIRDAIDAFLSSTSQ